MSKKRKFMSESQASLIAYEIGRALGIEYLTALSIEFRIGNIPTFRAEGYLPEDSADAIRAIADRLEDPE